MDEATWLASIDPTAMLEFWRQCGGGSDRKLRLFSFACCRRIWHLLTGKRLPKAVQLGELFADGLVPERDFTDAVESARLRTKQVWRKAHPRHLHHPDYRHAPAAYAAWAVAYAALFRPPDAADAAATAIAASCIASSLLVTGGCSETVSASVIAGRQAEVCSQAGLLRDLIGNLFRPLPPIEPSLLIWNGGLVPRLARTAYDDRLLPSGELDPVRLGVLADALEDAGCADAEPLAHLRSQGPHVRGCHAVDALLEKS